MGTPSPTRGTNKRYNAVLFLNYAVKSSYLLSFLESEPEVSDRLKEPNTGERKFEDVVKSAEQAAVLVLGY